MAGQVMSGQHGAGQVRSCQGSLVSYKATQEFKTCGTRCGTEAVHSTYQQQRVNVG